MLALVTHTPMHMPSPDGPAVQAKVLVDAGDPLGEEAIGALEARAHLANGQSDHFRTEEDQ